MKRKVDAHMIAVMGLLIALMVVLSRILGFETQFLKISFTFVPQLIMGMMFGPFWTGVGSALADVIGMSLLAKAPFFIGFTFNAFLGGVIYGSFFYKKEVTIKRAFLCTLTITILINLMLTPLWLSILYQVPLDSWVIWAPRLLKSAVMLPVQTMMIYIVGRAVPYKRLTRRFA